MSKQRNGKKNQDMRMQKGPKKKQPQGMARAGAGVSGTSFRQAPSAARQMQRPVQAQRQLQRPAQNSAGGQPERRKTRYFYDYSLLFAVFFLFVFGLIMIYSSSQYTAALQYDGDSTYFFKRQAMIGGAGLLGAIVISKFGYAWLRFFATPFYRGDGQPAHGLLDWFVHQCMPKCLRLASTPVYLLSVGILFATAIMGIASHGQTRWIEIAGVRFQPTEPVKVAIIVWVAAEIARRGYAINNWKKNVFPLLLTSLIPIGFIADANLSSGIIVAGIIAVMLFVGCRIYWPFIGCGTVALFAVLFGKQIVREIVLSAGITDASHYRFDRFLGWAMPEQFTTQSYQTMQGIYAIGSGGLTGQGLGESIQKFGKLPEAQNDMIFSIICEELGFIGAAAVIILFLFVIYRLMWIANNAKDLFGSMLCVGIMAHIGIQVILNIAVVTNVIPNTGVTLPFISYGGTASAFTMCEIGIALAVSNKIRLE